MSLESEFEMIKAYVNKPGGGIYVFENTYSFSVGVDSDGKPFIMLRPIENKLGEDARQDAESQTDR